MGHYASLLRSNATAPALDPLCPEVKNGEWIRSPAETAVPMESTEQRSLTVPIADLSSSLNEVNAEEHSTALAAAMMDTAIVVTAVSTASSSPVTASATASPTQSVTTQLVTTQSGTVVPLKRRKGGKR